MKRKFANTSGVKVRDRLSIGLLLIVMFFPSKFSFSQVKPDAPVLIEAGFASVDITPRFPIRMAGYAARLSTEADSVLQPLSAKALALGSDAQHPSVMITVDLVGITWNITNDVVEYLGKEKEINPAQISIFASHTHGGPEIGNLINILQYREGGHFTDSLLELSQLEHISEYTRELTQKLKDVAVAALNNRKPAYIAWGQGQALFAANRRTKGGPVDVALPILKVSNTDGSLRGVFVNYACHGTTLGGDMHKIHGDWITEAHQLIEKRHPGTVALIALGCAGDANPSPRGTIENMQQHGKEIADNVDKLLTAPLQALNTPPVGVMRWVKLPFSRIPDAEGWMDLIKDKTIKGYNARLALERVQRGEVISPTLDYPMQVWNFDNKMAMVNLGGEVVVDYSTMLKDEYGAEQLWINAYSNDVPCYIPSRRILREGGYEAETNMYWYNRPVPFAPEVENVILGAASEMMPAVFAEDRAKTNQPAVIRQQPDGSYDLVSWLASTKGDQIKYMSEWKAFGWFNTTDQSIWDVDIASSGKYDVYVEWSVSDDAAGKSIEFGTANRKLKAKVEKTGSWFTYRTKKIGTLRLKQGKETMVLKSGAPREKGPMFDLRRVLLIPVK